MKRKRSVMQGPVQRSRKRILTGNVSTSGRNGVNARKKYQIEIFFKKMFLSKKDVSYLVQNICYLKKNFFVNLVLFPSTHLTMNSSRTSGQDSTGNARVSHPF